MHPPTRGAAVVCGGGLLGRAITTLLHQSRPTTVVDTNTEVAGQLPDGVAFHHGDLTDTARLSKELPKDTVVFVYAAGALPPAFADDPVAAHRRSLDAFTGFLSHTAFLARPCRVVLCSSLAVYGPHTPGATEATEPAPATPYGHHKMAIESMLRKVAPVAGLSCAILRFCGIVGPVTQVGGGWMHRALSAAAAGPGGPAYDQASQALCGHEYLHVQDAAKAAVLAAQSDLHGTWNIGSGVVPAPEEVARALGRRTGGTPPAPPARPGAATGLVWAKARTELGYEPEYQDFSSIVESVVNHDNL